RAELAPGCVSCRTQRARVRLRPPCGSSHVAYDAEARITHALASEITRGHADDARAEGARLAHGGRRPLQPRCRDEHVVSSDEIERAATGEATDEACRWKLELESSPLGSVPDDDALDAGDQTKGAERHL